MIYASKGNKVYQVGENSAAQEDYLNRGYDITDESGNVLKHSPVKTVPYAQYAAVLAELEALKSEKEDTKK